MKNYREVRTCAVCGKVAACNKFGNGITCPKTTCLACKKRTSEYIEIGEVMNIKKIRRIK